MSTAGRGRSPRPAEGGLLGASRLRDLFSAHGVRPRKELGQNFVIDHNTIRKMVAAAGPLGDESVLEIGAGAGSLTLGIAGAARKVVAVEFDRRLLPVLSETVEGLTNVEIVAADALTLDVAEADVTVMVANLPYNIATPLVVRTLEEAAQIETLTVMTQREVGERLVARPGSKSYGQVSVLVGYFARGDVVARVSRRAFYPVPEVDSVIVRLERRPKRPDTDYGRLRFLVKAGFAQRRKTLRNALVGTAGSAPEVEQMLATAGVDATARAETVPLEGWLAMAGAGP